MSIIISQIAKELLTVGTSQETTLVASNVATTKSTTATTSVTTSEATSEVIIGADEATAGGEIIILDETDSEAAALEQSAVDATEEAAVEGDAAVEGEVAVEGEATEEVPVEGSEDIVSEGEVVIDAATEEMLMKEGIVAGENGGDAMYTEGMNFDPGFGTVTAKVKDPLLSSWIFVIGITAAVLVVSIALGALLAKRKIKKGIELYED